MKKRGLLIILSGPSGAGKTTIERALLKKCKNLRASVSVTTRDRRKGEKDGKDYHFWSLKKFKNAVRAGRFLEYAEVFGNYYGTLEEYVLKDIGNGKNVLLTIDVQGGKVVKKKLKDAVAVFVLPPSMKELERRLKRRGRDTLSDIEKRLNIAKREIAMAKMYDYFVINRNVEDAVNEVVNIIYVENNNNLKRNKEILDVYTA